MIKKTKLLTSMIKLSDTQRQNVPVTLPVVRMLDAAKREENNDG